MPRQSTYSEALAQEIVDGLCTGETLESMCRRLDYMPSPWSIGRWRKAHPEFEASYREARRIGFDHIAADCLEIADDGSRDYPKDEDGHSVVDHDHIQRSKLRIDTRLKLLAKWDPKRWGDKLELAGNAKRPLIIEIQQFSLDA